MNAIIVINAGSTSLKFGAYAVDAAGSLPLLSRGQIDAMQGDPHFAVKNAAGKPVDAHEWGEGHAIDHKTALHFVITWLETNIADMKVVAAGHRVVLDGRSVDTTMGFGAVSGLPMTTRSGDVPAGALFYLLRSKLFDDASLEKMLYQRAGLLGLSGSSGDVRVLQDSGDPRAVAAMESFVYAMTKYTGAYASVLSGLDAFVFTAGIGEHSAPVRAALCDKLAWLGIRLDEQANASGGPRISGPDSGVSVWVIPTNEELMIAQHTLSVVKAAL